MVVPHEEREIGRSLVGVPGSGSCKSAGSECLDLARASCLAASVPVSLPPALVTLKRTPPTSPPVNKLDTHEGVAASILPRSSEGRKRPHHEISSGASNAQPTKARIVYLTPQELQNHASRVVPVSTPAGPVLFLAAQPRSETSPPIILDQTTLSNYIKERDNLVQENQELQRRLTLFKLLFKDKMRLSSVVQRLGVNVL